MIKLLIIDDEKDITKMLRDYFTCKNYNVITANNGEEALKKITLNPDIILLDINMPDIDGIEVCKRIREFVNCPILFLTAKIEDADKLFEGQDRLDREGAYPIALGRSHLPYILPPQVFD